MELAIGEMSDDIGHHSNSVEGLKTRVQTACQDTQDLRDETLGLVNSVRAMVRKEIAKMREELLRQLTNIRIKVESVKEDVILCKNAAVTGGVTIQAGPKMEVPQPEKESRREKGKRVEEGDQDEKEASHPKAKHANHGKDKAKSKWESKGDDRDGGESAPTVRMGAMVMNEDVQLANIRLVNTSRVEDDDPKGRTSSISSSTDIKQGGSLMIVNGEVNKVPTRLLVDTGASHNFLAKEEAKALGVMFTKVECEMKAINSRATPVYGRAWNVLFTWGSGRVKSTSWWSTLMMRMWCWAWSSCTKSSDFG
uniref:Uncharacterized protein n=1 Tax=Chenopodium quinoa TaxID=63459 RepID=A0A803N3Y3_CHEQI